LFESAFRSRPPPHSALDLGAFLVSEVSPVTNRDAQATCPVRKVLPEWPGEGEQAAASSARVFGASDSA